ncbi:hypothetical protein T01_2814 [Trichinella spiralis]|uniref:Uncharacterized protein n=1 Tax=Trichinella spiralis TaxID=6334 RepID=A0A0V0YRP6_TRISP|nr:hypothetical protein T01_2814 [Trichinella spiralis]
MSDCIHSKHVVQNQATHGTGIFTVWYYSVPLFSHWSLPTLFYWTVKS